MNTFLIIIVLIGTLSFSEGFSIQGNGVASDALATRNRRLHQEESSALFSTPPDGGSKEDEIISSIAPPPETPSLIQEEEEPSYPIPLPSPILLATSMVLGIATTGSIFELTGATTPSLGVPVTAGIVVLGLPTCLFLFYASIQKAIAETEEDDKKYRGGM